MSSQFEMPVGDACQIADAESLTNGVSVISVRLVLTASYKDVKGDTHKTSYEALTSDWLAGDDDDDDPHSEEAFARQERLRTLKLEMEDILAPVLKNYEARGFFRADLIYNEAHPDYDLEDGKSKISTIAFFLIARDVDLGAGELEAFGNLALVSKKTASLVEVSVRSLVENSYSVVRIHQLLCERGNSSVVGAWARAAGEDKLPCEEEPLPDWIERVGLKSKELRRRLCRWEMSGYDVELYGKCGSATERLTAGDGIQWLVQGLVQRGVVTLLVGTQEAGKSTAANELAAMLGSESTAPRHFLGVEITDRFACVILSGEDQESVVDARNEFYEPIHGEFLGVVFDDVSLSLKGYLEKVRRMPRVDLIIVDPVRKFLNGDEDSSDAASKFYDELTAIAREKNCAVLAIHHLRKGPPPRRLEDVGAAIRGSGVHANRARMIVAMIDRGQGVTEVGIIKHNIPPSEQVWHPRMQGRLFRRDAATLTLVPIEGTAASEPKVASKDTDITSVILAALKKQTDIGRNVYQSGESELFKWGMSELAGLSRATIRSNVGRLLAEGCIISTRNGLVVNTPA